MTRCVLNMEVRWATEAMKQLKFHGDVGGAWLALDKDIAKTDQTHRSTSPKNHFKWIEMGSHMMCVNKFVNKHIMFLSHLDELNAI